MNHHFVKLDDGVSADVKTASAFVRVLAMVLLASLLQVFWRCCCLCYRKYVKKYLSVSSSTGCDMDPTTIASVEKILNYTFKSKNLLVEALTHSSFGENMSYERLEFIGDAALGLAVANHFFCLEPQQKLTPGEMTQLRQDTVNNKRLARMAAEHGLYRFVRRKNTALDRDVKKYEEAVKQGDDQNIKVKNPDVLADIVESLAGAVYLDVYSDLSKLWMIFREILEVNEIELPKDEGDGSSEITGAQNDLVVKDEGCAHDKKYVYLVEIRIGDHVVRKRGDEKSSKKDARNSAASIMYKYLILDVPTAITSVESILNFTFKNKNLLVEALTHSSVRENLSYERLEFIGDAALGLAVATHFFCLKQQQKLTPGEMKKLRKDTVNNEKFACLAAKHGLYWFVRRENTASLDRDVEKYEEAVKQGDDQNITVKNPDILFYKVEKYEEAVKQGDDQNITVKNPDILADIVESLAGAVYLDGNFDLSKLWMIFREILEVDEIELPKDEGDGSSEITGAQNYLYGLCGRRKRENPHYRVVKDEGCAHDKKYVYLVEIRIGDHVVRKRGDEKSSKKDARNSAASILIRSLQESGII
ncbi:hypothetical protein DITRI_Ditri01bG0184900 [Diplodiscus trichospermus]